MSHKHVWKTDGKGGLACYICGRTPALDPNRLKADKRRRLLR